MSQRDENSKVTDPSLGIVVRQVEERSRQLEAQLQQINRRLDRLLMAYVNDRDVNDWDEEPTNPTRRIAGPPLYLGPGDQT